MLHAALLLRAALLLPSALEEETARMEGERGKESVTGMHRMKPKPVLRIEMSWSLKVSKKFVAFRLFGITPSTYN